METIRNANPSELEALLKVEVASHGEDAFDRYTLRQYLDLFSGNFLVYASNEKLLGIAIGGLKIGTSNAWILELAVVPEARNQGVGRKLLLALLEKLKDQGISKISLTVDQKNSSARHLYSSLGFVEVREEKNYFGEGHDRLILENSR